MKKKLIAAILASNLFLVLFTVPVQAQRLLPEEITNLFNLLGPEGQGTAGFVTSRVQTGLFIALGIVILIAVAYALVAAIKYIQSQGDPGKIEEAQKAIKSIFMGIAAMLIAIVGIILVFVFFGTGRTQSDLYQTCLSAPNSPGCRSCKAAGEFVIQNNDGTFGTNGGGADAALCAECENAYREAVESGNPLDPAAHGDCVDPLSTI